MDWERLITDKRFGLEDLHVPRRGSRTDFQRDFDRLVFSSPFRRLQNKTQVFPLPGSIFVHNRLTHSVEVASVGRSMANEVTKLLLPRHRGTPAEKSLESIGEIVAAACLAHDMGNPPFGHSGEKAIATFFSEGAGAFLRDRLTAAQWADLVHFEGNANALRVLTHRFHGRREGGFAMTYPMLASIVKYPWSSGLAGGRDKFGFFTSEHATWRRIATELGMFSAVSDKDYRDMIHTICSRINFRKVVTTEVGGYREVPSKELADIFSGEGCKEVGNSDSIEDAFHMACDAKGEDGMLFCVGSLYLVGEIKSLLLKEKKAQ